MTMDDQGRVAGPGDPVSELLREATALVPVGLDPETYNGIFDLLKRFYMQGRDDAGTPRVRGEDHGRALLTEAQVRKIRNWPKSYGYRQTLSDMFGVSIYTITDIRSRKSWKHVAEEAPRG
jgi:hypothetical protein